MILGYVIIIIIIIFIPGSKETRG